MSFMTFPHVKEDRCESDDDELESKLSWLVIVSTCSIILYIRMKVVSSSKARLSSSFFVPRARASNARDYATNRDKLFIRLSV